MFAIRFFHRTSKSQTARPPPVLPLYTVTSCLRTFPSFSPSYFVLLDTCDRTPPISSYGLSSHVFATIYSNVEPRLIATNISLATISSMHQDPAEILLNSLAVSLDIFKKSVSTQQTEGMAAIRKTPVATPTCSEKELKRVKTAVLFSQSSSRVSKTSSSYYNHDSA